MFKDSSWFFKVFLGGIFLVGSVVVVGLPLIAGYVVEYIRRVAEEEDSALPEWKNLKKLYRQGLVVLGAALAYAALLLSFIVAVSGKPSASLTLLSILSVIFLWMPLVLIQYTKRPTFVSCFSILEILKRSSLHPLIYLGSLAAGLLTVLASVLFGWMSMIIGWPFVVFWGVLVQCQIIGQLAAL